MMLIDPNRFRGSSLASISYEGSVTGASGNVPSVPIGAASSARTVIQVISWAGVTGITLNAATIGGIAADICVQLSALQAGPLFGYAAIISADVPSGTTATTDLTFSTATAPVVSSFRAIGLISKTATDTETATIFGPTSGVVSPDVLAGGLIVAGVTARSASSFTITGATEAYDSTVAPVLQIAGGSYTTPTAELAHGITFASTTYSGPIVAAAFR